MSLYNPTSTAGAVPRIPKSEGATISSRDQVLHWVERPLVEAVSMLVDKGIPTYSSSASATWPEAEVTLWLRPLSLENREIAIRIGGEILEDHRGSAEPYLLGFGLPISEQTPEKVISEWAERLADALQPQPIASVREVEEIMAQMMPGAEECTHDQILEYIPHARVFDEQRELFFLNKTSRDLFQPGQGRDINLLNETFDPSADRSTASRK